MGAAAAGFCCGRELRTNSRAESAERKMGLVSNMGELQLDFGALVRRERNVARLGEIFLQNGGIGVLQLGIVHREKLVVARRKLGELEGGGGVSAFGNGKDEGGVVACVKGDPAFENREIVAQDDFDRLNGGARRDG